MTQIDPVILSRYSKEELINYIVMSGMSRMCKELYNTVKEGEYRTRYDLCKIYKTGTVGYFIKQGLAYGYLKRDWKYIGEKKKAILRVAVPSEELVIKAVPEKELIAE